MKSTIIIIIIINLALYIFGESTIAPWHICPSGDNQKIDPLWDQSTLLLDASLSLVCNDLSTIEVIIINSSSLCNIDSPVIETSTFWSVVHIAKNKHVHSLYKYFWSFINLKKSQL